MNGVLVLSLSHTDVNDGQRMHSMGRLKRWERIEVFFSSGTETEVISFVEAEYGLYWGQLPPGLCGEVEATGPPPYKAPQHPFPCRAVRKYREKTAMFHAHTCPARGRHGGCCLYAQAFCKLNFSFFT